MNRKAVFLDKDGTLINDVPYNVDPELIKLSPDCIKGLQLLQHEGYLLIIISNQSGVARGYFTEADLMPVKTKLKKLLGEHGLKLNGFYYCPHHPEGTVAAYSLNCLCRKPMPGMLLKAAHDMDIDIENSWMVGDILNDVEAGNKAGCRTILIDNGNETEWFVNDLRVPEKMVKNINEAADYIMTAVGHGSILEKL
jgi:D-glycero-D-manno-heptose 1,7-bisphosphate phosphatase